MIRNMLSISCAIFLALIGVACQTQDTAHTPTPTSAPILEPISQSSPIPDDVEMVILRQIAVQWCLGPTQLGSPSFSVEDNQAGFSCPTSAGHSVGVTIHRYPDLGEAQAAFGDGEALFHCYSARKQEAGDHPSKRRQYEWQAERWLVQVRATDDTPYGANLEPILFK